MKLNRKKFNPLGFHLLSLLKNPDVRIIILQGGSSSGKTYSAAQVLLLLALNTGENTLVLRKVGATISKTVWKDFKKAAKRLGIAGEFRFKEGIKQIVCLANGALIDFGGLDDPEKIKGISDYKRVLMDEFTEFDEPDFKQVRKRLRGEAGQQVITTFNPISESHWIKKKVYDAEKWHDIPMTVTLGGRTLPLELTKVKAIKMNNARHIMNPRTGEMYEHAPDTVIIQTTYLNNFWVVGSPDGTYGYYDEQCIADFEKDRVNDPDFYNVYALGEWGVIQTGSEFFSSFKRPTHTGPVPYDPKLPIHISVDSNVLPYITITYWQIETEWPYYDEEKEKWLLGVQIRQIGETTAEAPYNTVRKAAKLATKRLKGYNSPFPVYLHGDASTKAANNIDDEKRSFMDLFIDTLTNEGLTVEDKVGKKNPSVPMSGEFINAIYEGHLPGLSIFIGDECKVSIEDYMSVQKDVNGGILKTRVKNKITMQTYEEHGHISDTKRYIVCDALKEEFTKFSNKRKRNTYAQNGFIHYYNPDITPTYTKEVVYTMPNINGKFVMVHGKLCGDRWHIVGVSFRETSSTEEIKTALADTGAGTIIVECAQSYYQFIKDLRKEVKGVRVMPEEGDLDRRIAATSDYVKDRILFNEALMDEEDEYDKFMSSLFDYNKDNENKEASAVLSGFVKFVAKSVSKPIKA